MLHNEAPTYLCDLLSPLVQNANSCNLRNLNDLRMIHIRAWNELDESIKQATSLSSFKYLLNRNIKHPPKEYKYGTRKSQILHARLRMECSSLNAHLYRKNIVDSPSVAVSGAHTTIFTCVQIMQISEMNVLIMNWRE